MWSIRSFLNVDTPLLAKIWHLHHAAYGSKSDCTVMAWDQAVLAKPYFHNDDLLIAEDPDEGVVGFLHMGSNPEAGSIGKEAGIVHRLCVRPGQDEDAIAKDLLSQCNRRMGTIGLDRCIGLGAFHDSIFYIGIAEGDGFLGVNSKDVRLIRWMQNHAFLPLQATECWELSLASFKPPMDRNQINVHRNTLVSRILGNSQSPWWQSVVFGHCDMSSFQLVTKTKPTLELRVDIWTPEVFVPGVESWIARFIIPEISSQTPGQEMLVEHWVCLLSECLRLLLTERKQLVQVVIDPSCAPHVQILHRLGFKSKLHGMLMTRNL